MISALTLGCLQNTGIQKENKTTGTQEHYTITDDYGREIEIPKDVKRIISTAPANTETLFAINASEKIVGVTNYADYPPRAKNITSVGGFQNPSTEKIVLLNPDVVIANPQTGERVGSLLTKLHIPVVVINPGNITEIMEDIELIGKIANKEEEAKELTNEMREQITEINQQTDDLKQKKTLFIISGYGGNYWVAGKGTFINELIQISSGENVAKNVEGYKRVGLESIQKWNPQKIIYPSDSGINQKTFLNNSGFQNITAVEEKNIHEIENQDPVMRSGPRIVEGLKIVAEKIHSDSINYLYSLIKAGGVSWV